MSHSRRTTHIALTGYIIIPNLLSHGSFMSIDITQSYDSAKISHLQSVWEKVISQLASIHDHKKIISFLGKTAIIDINTDDKKVFIGVPNQFVLTQIKKFLGKDITKSLHENYDAQFTAQYDIFAPFQEGKHPLHIDMLKTLWVDQLKETSPLLDQKTKTALSKYFGILFDKNYTFNSLIIGAHNQMAAGAAQAIAAEPGKAYNPFFVYGNVWLGKTHLMQAIGNKIMQEYPEKVVVYLPTSKLVDEIIGGIRKNKLTNLMQKLEEVDVLLLDDIQFIAKKDKTQEIFHNIFNDFHMKEKQIIITSDRPPKELNDIAERLKSRFSLWLVTDVSQPDFETRLAILQSKAQAKNVEIDDALLEILATHVTDNIREIEWALNIIITKMQLTGKDITPNDIYECLHTLGYKNDFTKDEEVQTANTRTIHNMDDIVALVATYYHIAPEDIIGDSRKKQISLARKICMKIAKEQFGRTLEKIGEYFGGKNHATVIYSIESLTEDLKQDSYLARDWEFIQGKVQE